MINYHDPNPAHARYVQEIQTLGEYGFNNLYMKLPGSAGREFYQRRIHQLAQRAGGLEKIVDPAITSILELFKHIDEGIGHIDFDLPAFEAESINDPKNTITGTRLCPLYIYLRTKGIAKEMIIK